MEEDFKIESEGGPTAATKEFSGAGEQATQVIEPETSGDGEQIVGDGEAGGYDGGDNIGNDQKDSQPDPGNQDDSDSMAQPDPDSDIKPEDVKLSDNTLVDHDQESPASDEEETVREPIDPAIVDKALETALDSQVPFEVNSNLLEFVAGDRVHLRAQGQMLTVDVIAIDPDSEDCVGLNQTSSDLWENIAHLVCGGYVKFKKQNVMNVV